MRGDRPTQLPSTQVYDPLAIEAGTVYTPQGHASYLDLTPAQRAQFQRFEYDRSKATDERLEQDSGRLHFQEGSPPNRIPWLWKDFLGAWAGTAQHGFTQWNYRMYLRPPVSPVHVTRATKSVRGITQRVAFNSGMVRIPAVYVPSSVG